MYTVYKHTTPSGKVYIGATGQNPKRRWDNGKGYRHNRRFCDAIRKYGWGNIEHEVISAGLDKEQAYAMEAELIAECDTTNPAKGYNISIGGEYGGLGRSHSNEARRKMSEAKCKKVVCVETGGVYRSLSEASKAAGVSLNAISNALCGESKTSGGYHWTYAK